MKMRKSEAFQVEISFSCWTRSVKTWEWKQNEVNHGEKAADTVHLENEWRKTLGSDPTDVEKWKGKAFVHDRSWADTFSYSRHVRGALLFFAFRRFIAFTLVVII